MCKLSKNQQDKRVQLSSTLSESINDETSRLDSTLFPIAKSSTINDKCEEGNKNRDKFNWEMYSNGFASKMINEMRYKGKGLGKSENGITEPIEIEKKHRFNYENENYQSNKTVCILSDSILNQIDGKRLCNTKDITIMCHGGCTTKCMFSHLPDAFKLNPKYIILHIVTNDKKKTSDVILRELEKLKKYIEKKLPSCNVIISLPTIRTDNNKANAIITKLNYKLNRSGHRFMNNSNIK